jgi:hypothetical protein
VALVPPGSSLAACRSGDSAARRLIQACVTSHGDHAPPSGDCLRGKLAPFVCGQQTPARMGFKLTLLSARPHRPGAYGTLLAAAPRWMRKTNGRQGCEGTVRVGHAIDSRRAELHVVGRLREALSLPGALAYLRPRRRRPTAASSRAPWNQGLARESERERPALAVAVAEGPEQMGAKQDPRARLCALIPQLSEHDVELLLRIAERLLSRLDVSPAMGTVRPRVAPPEQGTPATPAPPHVVHLLSDPAVRAVLENLAPYLEDARVALRVARALDCARSRQDAGEGPLPRTVP